MTVMIYQTQEILSENHSRDSEMAARILSERRIRVLGLGARSSSLS